MYLSCRSQISCLDLITDLRRSALPSNLTQGSRCNDNTRGRTKREDLLGRGMSNSGMQGLGKDNSVQLSEIVQCLLNSLIQQKDIPTGLQQLHQVLGVVILRRHRSYLDTIVEHLFGWLGRMVSRFC
jgi:hypothetical protein